ncbi:MAG: serine hydrolase [Gemmatimonadaceae bacterium]|jgi:CubicO group peptidase (beta-lactamase class C family)|nr:serine hydrolase [Gemmatimonadaceae bacterium]
MRTRRRFGTGRWLALAGCLAAPLRGQDAPLRTLVEARVAIGANPAIAAVRITPAGPEVAFAGTPVSPDGRPLGPRTLFEIGSITKVVTGTLFADAVRRGEVREDERLVGVLPGLPLPVGGDAITLLDLATHRSGLESFPSGHVPPDAGDPWGAVDSLVLTRAWSRSPLRFAPGTKAEYSNVAAGILGRALVARAGMLDYGTLVRERFAQPLGMSDFAVSLDADQRARFATGHTRSGDSTSHWTLPALPGAGAIVASLEDMQRLAEACLGRGPEPLVAAVTEAQRARRDFVGGARIGLHWILLPRPDGSMIAMHGGGTGGFRSWIGCNRATQRAAVVLTNSDVGADDLGLHLVDPALPLRPPERPVRRVAIAVDPAAMDSLAGRYAFSPLVGLEVRRVGARLQAQLTAQPAVELFAEARDRWFLKVVDAQLEFERDATGRIAAAILVQNGLRQRAVRVP